VGSQPKNNAWVVHRPRALKILQEKNEAGKRQPERYSQLEDWGDDSKTVIKGQPLIKCLINSCRAGTRGNEEGL